MRFEPADSSLQHKGAKHHGRRQIQSQLRRGKFGPHFIAASALAIVFACLIGRANGQAAQQGTAELRGLTNGGFEELNPAGLPTGWLFPPALKAAGYRAGDRQCQPHRGQKQCAA